MGFHFQALKGGLGESFNLFVATELGVFQGHGEVVDCPVVESKPVVLVVEIFYPTRRMQVR
jgi:hypothetical protein